MKQINNLKIKYSKVYNNWYIETLDKRKLEEFKTKEEAIKGAENIKDFI